MQKLNDTTYKTIANDNPKDLLEIIVGDDKQPDFKPQIKLQRWDNEVNFSVRLKTDKPILEVKKEIDKIRCIYDKMEIQYFEAEEGFKMIPILYEKPSSNALEFTLQSKGVDFFYQLPLVEEYKNGYCDEFKTEIVVSESKIEDLNGKVLLKRNDNVNGSYAIYASDEKINITGGKLYKCGKVGHIYRPKIIDANGEWVWGDLKIDKEAGTYVLTSPQKFLDEAVYPIRSNDEFGYHTIGGTSINQTNTEGDLCLYALSVTGDISQISWYSRMSSGTSDQYGLIYDDDGSSGEPATLLGTSAVVTINTVASWHDAALTISSLPAGNYWLGLYNTTATDYYYKDSGGTSRWKSGLGSIPNPWPNASDNHTTNKFSIYATYTPSGATTFIPKIIII